MLAFCRCWMKGMKSRIEIWTMKYHSLQIFYKLSNSSLIFCMWVENHWSRKNLFFLARLWRDFVDCWTNYYYYFLLSSVLIVKREEKSIVVSGGGMGWWWWQVHRWWASRLILPSVSLLWESLWFGDDTTEKLFCRFTGLTQGSLKDSIVFLQGCALCWKQNQVSLQINHNAQI